MTDPNLKRLTKAILRAQKRLGRVASDKAWRAYMRLEAVVNARQDEIIERAMALAYRSRRKRSAESNSS